MNEFYALLVPFKDPGEPQRKERLLPCRLDPIQLLKDVEWLQRGPAQSLRPCEADGHWKPLKTSKHTAHTYSLTIPCEVTMVSGECRRASRSRSLVIPPCLAAMFVRGSVCVHGRHV